MKRYLYTGSGVVAPFAKKLLGGLLASLLLLAFSACEFHTGDNGDLDGFWHLESMENTQTGEVTYLGNQTIFWSYQVDLMYLQGASTGSFFLRFTHADNALTLYSPYADGGHSPEGDVLLEDPAPLLPYGITALEETFQVERLDGGTMVLRSEAYRLSFTKF
mgnify:FL=1